MSISYDRVIGRIWGHSKLVQLKTVTDPIKVVKHTLSNEEAKRVEPITSDRVGDRIDIDIVLDKTVNAQKFLDDIKAKYSTEKIRIYIHKCYHKEYGGTGEPCEAPHLKLELN